MEFLDSLILRDEPDSLNNRRYIAHHQVKSFSVECVFS
jgi:hypothetical protein